MNSPKRPISPDSRSQSWARPAFLTLWEYWSVIVRNWRWVLLVTIVLLTANAIRLYLVKSVYASSASVEVFPSRLSVGSEEKKDSSFEYTSATIFNTLLEISRTPSVTNRLIEKVGPEKTAQLLGLEKRTGNKPYSRDKLTSELMKRMQTNQIAETFIMEISVEAYTPEAASMLANAWAQSLIEVNRDSSIEQSRETGETMGKQVERIQLSINEKEARLAELAKSSQIQVLDQQLNVTAEELRNLNEQLQLAQREVLDKQARYSTLQRTPAGAIPELQASSSVSPLTMSCNLAEQEYADKSKIFKPDWPGLQQLKTKRDETCAQRDMEVQSQYQRFLQQARAEVESARSKEYMLQRSFQNAKNAVDSINSQTSEYQALKADLDNEKQLLQQMIRQRQTAEITEVSGLQTGIRMQIVDPAQPINDPVRPKRLQSMAVSMILGLAAGLGLAFLINYLDPRIHTQYDVQQNTSFRFLTFLPEMEKDEEEDRELKRNAFRFLWRHISSVLKDETGPRVILVTSAQPEEGKTFVASNLALARAMSGKRVLLMDLDVQRPRVHEMFQISRTPCLEELLSGPKVPDFTPFRTAYGNLTVVPGAQDNYVEAGDLLEETRFIEILTAAMREFQYIILDTGPVLITPETLAAARGIDGVLMVVRSGFTTSKALRIADDLMVRTNVPVLGVVLNRVNLKDRFSFYSYFNKYYYSYHKKPGSKEKAGSTKSSKEKEYLIADKGRSAV